MKNRENYRNDFEMNRRNYRSALALNGFAEKMSETLFRSIENVYYGCRNMDPNEIIQIEAECNDRFYRRIMQL